jgi:hypothetical protein
MTEISSSAIEARQGQPSGGAAHSAGLRVISVSTRRVNKKVVVESRNREKAVLRLHRFALVGNNDRLIVGDGLEHRVWIIDEDDRVIPVSPLFALHATHPFAGGHVETRVVELSTLEDFRDFTTAGWTCQETSRISEPSAREPAAAARFFCSS